MFLLPSTFLIKSRSNILCELGVKRSALNESTDNHGCSCLHETCDQKTGRNITSNQTWQTGYRPEVILGQGHQNFILQGTASLCYDASWYSGHRIHFLPSETRSPVWAGDWVYQAQAFSKPAVPKGKSLMKIDTRISSCSTFLSVCFGFNIIAKRGCQLFSTLTLF